MRKLYLLIIAVLVASMIQAQDKTLFKGRVVDNETGEALTGAPVRIAGTTQGTVTDINGFFSLRMPVGKTSLQVEYLGYEVVTLEVEVEDGQSSPLKIELKNAVTELQGVIVSGNLQGQARALNQQKSADNIKNIVAADQIGRFPDPNSAEALQRIPGANIERDQGEGRYVFIRGLAPKFTNINVNGEQIPSPESDVRFVALDAVPADQLSSIEVTKALTPDMDGDAIGGSVNLNTRTAQTSKPTISLTAAGGYNDLMSKGSWQGALQLGQRFGKNEKFGVLLNGSHYLSDRGSDNWERDDNELELRDYEIRRTRLGLSGTFDYKFSPRHEIYLRSLYTKFDDHEFRRRFIFVSDEDEPEIERTTKDRYEAQYVESYNFGGKHLFDGFTLDYELAYAYGEQDTPDDYEVGFKAEPDGVTVDFSDTEFPKLTVESEEKDGYLNKSIYKFDEFEFGSTLATDQNVTAKFNIEIPYTLAGNSASVKFGAKTRFKEKDFRLDVNKVSWDGDDDLLLTGIDGAGPDFTGGLVDDNFLNDKYKLSASADVDKVIKFYNDNLNGFKHELEDNLADEALEAYKATEDVYAGYLMTKVQMDKLMLLGGVRYEYTEVAYDSKNVEFNDEGDLSTIESISGGTDYGYVLPQVHAKYAVNNNFNIRAAATYSYSRPNFSEIVPSQEFNLQDEEITIGNPELEPTDALNLDLMAEKYFGTVGIVSGGLFHKSLDKFIYNNSFMTSTLKGRTFDGEVQVTQAINGGTATLTGFEFAYQQNLTFLPGILSGFGLYANYTYTSSEATINDLEGSEIKEEKISLPGQAEHMGNISLSYGKNKINARLSANFNGKYLAEIDEGNKIYLDDRMQLDFNASYTAAKGVQIFAEFMNLTDQPLEAYSNTEDHVIQREFYSWWSRFGVKLRL